MLAMIYTLTLNPSLDRHITVKKLVKDDKIPAETVRFDAGGKGINVSRVIKELGGRTKAFGIVGGYQGQIFKELLCREGIDHELCESSGSTRINLKIINLADRSHIQINAPGPRLNAGEVKRLLALVEQIIPRPSFWVLAGSIPPGVSDDTYKRLIQLFQKRGERCVLDTDGKSFKKGLEARPFLIKPNEFELERLLGRRCRTDRQLLATGRELTHKAEVVAITLGNKGALVVTKDDAWRLKGIPVKVQSHTGAGDAFLGGFLTALDKGDDLPTTARWAVAVATVSVMNKGTARCKHADVKQMIKRVTIKKC